MSTDPMHPNNPSPGRKIGDNTNVVLTPQAEQGLSRLASVLRQHSPDLCVLVVDDNDDDVQLLERAFQSVDGTIKVNRVKDGVEAIDYLEGNGVYSDRANHPLPLAILLDLGLPRANGLQVLNYIRNHPVLQDAVVVALTGSEDKHDAEEALQLGVTAYIQKPHVASHFVGIIQGLRTSGLF
jgi:CheY-like chemotaxis protein